MCNTAFMKLAVVGSRDVDQYEVVREILDTIYSYNPEISAVVSGGARGIDSYGAYWAKENDLPVTEYLPDWNKYGKRAGFVRNELIVKDADYVCAIWDGVSRGTLNSIDLARKYKKKLLVINVMKYEYQEDGVDKHVWEIHGDY